MNSNDKKSDTPGGGPLGNTGDGKNGDGKGKLAVTGGANEENITSGPGFFERWFGSSPQPKPVPPSTGAKPGDNKAVLKPADAIITDGSAKADGSAKPGDTTTPAVTTGGEVKDEKKEAPKPIFREPEGPLKPHYARSRAELLFEPEAPTVYMTPDAYKRMCLYVELAPKEVGWLGTISQRPNGDFLIEETFLVEQEVTSVETELSVEGSEKLVLELLEGGDPGLDKANKLHFWGHSHVRMGTSPSGTDESTMMRFSREGHEFYVRGIFNKLGRGTFDVYYYNKGFRILDVPWGVMDPKTGKVILKRSSGYYGGGNSGYNYGGSYNSQGGYQSTWKDRQAEQQDERSGLGAFLKREVPALISKEPDPLEIDEPLRTEVTAEYRAKVKERHAISFKWFGGGKKDEAEGGDKENPVNAGGDAPENQVVDGDLIPTGSDVRPSGMRTAGNGTDTTGAIKGAANNTTAQSGGGFWAWLGSIFESSPTPPAPERPRKKCTPENCQNPSHPWSKGYKGTPGNPNNSANRGVPDDRQ